MKETKIGVKKIFKVEAAIIIIRNSRLISP